MPEFPDRYCRTDDRTKHAVQMGSMELHYLSRAEDAPAGAAGRAWYEHLPGSPP